MVHNHHVCVLLYIATCYFIMPSHTLSLLLLLLFLPSSLSLSLSLSFFLSRGYYNTATAGAYGEVVPPQYHDNAPFIDEVWQNVAVDTTANTDGSFPWFIHQASRVPKKNLFS